MQINFKHWFISLLMGAALMLGACSPDLASSSPSTVASPSAATETSQTAASTETSPAGSPTESASDASPLSNSPVSSAAASNLPRLEGMATVELQVKNTPIVIEVNGADAPITAGNFVDLVQRGFYDGLSFHRVVREPQPFVVQGGDPQSKNPDFPPSQLGTGNFVDPATSKPRFIPLEIKPAEEKQPVYGQTFESAGVTKRPKLQHTRGAVAMARSALPDSASSQFYIALTDLDFLDGNYAVFGYVTKGMDVVDQIQQGDRIQSAKVIEGLDNLKTK